MSQELDDLKAKMSAFAMQLADASAASPPPGPNAANGFFREEAKKIPELPSVDDPSLGGIGDEAKALYDAFQKFQKDITETFKGCDNVKSDWTKNIPLALEFKDIVIDVLKLCGDVVQIIFGGEAKAASIIADIKQHIEKLVNDVNNKKAVESGTHANGYISKGVNKAAVDTIPRLQHQWSDDAKKLASALEITCVGLTQLKTTDHDPWLRASWQVQFQGIMESLGRSLA